MTENTSEPPKKSKRGFALMSKERQIEIARQGGIAAQATGAGHRYTSEEAQLAGRKGGLSVSRDREHMSRIGKRGGHALHTSRGKQSEEE